MGRGVRDALRGLRLQPAGLGVGRSVHEVDAQFGAVHEDVHARRFFGPPKDGRGRVIDLPMFLADLLAERIDAVGGRTQLRLVNFAVHRSSARLSTSLVPGVPPGAPRGRRTDCFCGGCP